MVPIASACGKVCQNVAMNFCCHCKELTEDLIFVKLQKSIGCAVLKLGRCGRGTRLDGERRDRACGAYFTPYGGLSR